MGESKTTMVPESLLIDGIDVNIAYVNDTDAHVTEKEALAYVARGREKFPHGHIKTVELRVDGEDVEVGYRLAFAPFERIRRITGYLVGTLDRFNDAKRAEEGDRVKHKVTPSW